MKVGGLAALFSPTHVPPLQLLFSMKTSRKRSVDCEKVLRITTWIGASAPLSTCSLASTQSCVSRRLVTNVILSFLATPRADSKRFEILAVLASVLSWNDHEREKAGLQRTGGVLSSLMGRGSGKGKAPELENTDETEVRASAFSSPPIVDRTPVLFKYVGGVSSQRGRSGRLARALDNKHVSFHLWSDQLAPKFATISSKRFTVPKNRSFALLPRCGKWGPELCGAPQASAAPYRQFPPSSAIGLITSLSFASLIHSHLHLTWTKLGSFHFALYSYHTRKPRYIWLRAVSNMQWTGRSSLLSTNHPMCCVY